MRAALLALLLPLAACDSTGGGAPDFGDAYRVVSASLDGDVLTVAVESSGGCRQHTYEPRERSGTATTEVWFVHDANGDMCEALVGQTLMVSVSPTGPVVLLTPDGRALPLR